MPNHLRRVGAPPRPVQPLRGGLQTNDLPAASPAAPPRPRPAASCAAPTWEELLGER